MGILHLAYLLLVLHQIWPFRSLNTVEVLLIPSSKLCDAAIFIHEDWKQHGKWRYNMILEGPFPQISNKQEDLWLMIFPNLQRKKISKSWIIISSTPNTVYTSKPMLPKFCCADPGTPRVHANIAMYEPFMVCQFICSPMPSSQSWTSLSR